MTLLDVGHNKTRLIDVLVFAFILLGTVVFSSGFSGSLVFVLVIFLFIAIFIFFNLVCLGAHPVSSRQAKTTRVLTVWTTLRRMSSTLCRCMT